MAVNKIRRKGSYAPLSAHYYKDDAIDEAGLDAELLYVRGLAFCADVLSDGHISDRQLTRFVGVGMDDAVDRAKRLVEVGLWGRVDGGYSVRSWLEWNRSKAEITEYQAKDAARKRPGDSDGPDPDPPTGPPEPSERTPNGIHEDSEPPSERSPNGIRPRARTPLHSTPRNSKTEKSSATAAPPLPEAATPPSDASLEPDTDEPRRDDVDALCDRLHDWMIKNGAKPPTITKRWRQQARLLLDRDKRELAKALNLIDWCQQNTFWMTNIHSIPTFRDQYDKLAMQAREEWRQNGERAKANADAYDPDKNPWAGIRFV